VNGTDLPLPAGAAPDIWQLNDHMPYRVLFGVPRGVIGRDITIGTTAIQFSDSTSTAARSTRHPACTSAATSSASPRPANLPPR
jgi:hypothetical protein